MNRLVERETIMRKIGLRSVLIGTTALLCAAGSAGCTGSTPGNEIVVNSSESALAAPPDGGVTYWDWDVPIPVCWRTTNIEEIKEIGRVAIERTWNTVTSHIKFVGWTDCTTAMPGQYVTVCAFDLTDHRPDGVLGDAPLGKNFATPNGNPIDGSEPHDQCIVKMWVELPPADDPGTDAGTGGFPAFDAGIKLPPRTYSDWRKKQEQTIVHEFGHVLGFAHEQNRPDNTGACTPDPGEEGTATTYYTAYDDNTIMTACRNTTEPSGMLSDLDIIGVQKVYGRPVSTVDSDGDTFLDYEDNCPYASNADQRNSNLDAETIVAQRTGFNGGKPTSTSTDAYIDQWRSYYKGDACDPNPVASITHFDTAATSSDTVTCVTIDLRGPIHTTYGGQCPAKTTAGLRFDGRIGDGTSMRLDRDGHVGATSCACEYMATADKGRCQGAPYNCPFANDSLFPGADDSGSQWKNLSAAPASCHYPNCNVSVFAQHMGVTHIARGWDFPQLMGYSEVVWNFRSDLPKFGLSSANTAFNSIIWSHVIDNDVTPQTDLGNSYEQLDAHLYGGLTIIPPNTAATPINWMPDPAIDPRVSLVSPASFVKQWMSVEGNRVVLAQTPWGLDDVTHRFTPQRNLSTILRHRFDQITEQRFVT